MVVAQLDLRRRNLDLKDALTQVENGRREVVQAKEHVEYLNERLEKRNQHLERQLEGYKKTNPISNHAENVIHLLNDIKPKLNGREIQRLLELTS